VKKSEATHINKDSSPLSVLLLLLFFSEMFHLLVEQTNLYYRLPDITLPSMMTFIAIPLQMGHELRETVHDFWSRPAHSVLGETTTRDGFLHITFSVFCGQYK
jgi:hypothetical protein